MDWWNYKNVWMDTDNIYSSSLNSSSNPVMTNLDGKLNPLASLTASSLGTLCAFKGVHSVASIRASLSVWGYFSSSHQSRMFWNGLWALPCPWLKDEQRKRICTNRNIYFVGYNVYYNWWHYICIITYLCHHISVSSYSWVIIL